MGCAASTASTTVPLEHAQAVQPAASAGGDGGGSGGALRHSDLTAPLAPLGAAGPLSTAPPLSDLATQQAVHDASRVAASSFHPCPLSDPPALDSALSAASTGAAAAAALDAIESDYMGASDVDAISAVLTAPECGLFATEAGAGAGGVQTLEISAQSVAELALLCGGAPEAVRLLRSLDARGVKCASMSELPAAIAQQQEDEAMAAAALLSAEERAALKEARRFLSRPSCALYPYAVPPRVASASSAASDAAALSLDHHEELEMDFNAVNAQLVGCRVRARFLHPVFLAQLVQAAGGIGGGGDAGAKGSKGGVLLVLQHLSLSEQSFELPSELLRGVLGHRARAIEAQRSLRSKAASLAASGSPPAPVPHALATQVAPLQSALAPVVASCARLEPLAEPLLPALSASLAPTLRHLQAYLSRFLPLLRASHDAAREAQVAPEDDDASAQILRAYLVPFLKLMQPWLLGVRPFLAGLQPFFAELQPFLTQTHAAFTALQPFLHGLAPFVSEPAPFLIADETGDSGSGLSPALSQCVVVLVALHPLLCQLHPLCQGLLDFILELSVFLGQVHSLLQLLAHYQTLPLEERNEPEAGAGAPAAATTQRQDSLSSIAVAWFGADSSSRPPSSDGSLSGAHFLARYGHCLPKLTPYVEQLRPFTGEMKVFVENFAPFVAQLAPFYRANLKDCVAPLLPFLVPVQHEQQQRAGTATSAAASQPPLEEMDEATLQRVLSS